MKEITAEDIASKDTKYLHNEIVERLTEYKKSENRSRGELLTEIQILMNRIDSIHSERFENRSRFLELVVVVLIAIEVLTGVMGYIDGRAQQRALQAIESNTRETSKALEKQQHPAPGQIGRVQKSFMSGYFAILSATGSAFVTPIRFSSAE